MFCEVPERIDVVLDYKIIHPKSPKFAFLQRGYTMVFVKKLNFFPSFVLMENGSIKRVPKSCKTKKALI